MLQQQLQINKYIKLLAFIISSIKRLVNNIMTTKTTIGFFDVDKPELLTNRSTFRVMVFL